MKNNKGFTLIELLAVMVILAIIALIATPVVMNVIKNARRAAAVDSAYGIIKAAEAYYASELLATGGNFDETNKGTNLTVDGTGDIKYKGTSAEGTLSISTDGVITFTSNKNDSLNNPVSNSIRINGFACTLSATDGKVTCA